MKVVLLAGGYGTRISEESQYKPKPMIEIGGKPILWHIMKEYSYYGFNEFIICAGYKQYVIKEWFADYFLHNSDITFDFTNGKNEQIIHGQHCEPWKVTVIDTGLNTMTGGRIKRIQPYVGNEPFTIFLMNNQGYHSIRMTQSSYFAPPLVGVGSDSGDLSFPDLAKLAPAYGYEFRRCEKAEDMIDTIEWGLSQTEPCICEMMLSTQQITEPKASSRKLDNGQMVSAPLEDMAPFLTDEELRNNMYIPVLEPSRG